MIGAQTWQTVWSDDFSTGTVPNSTRWGYETGHSGWGNNELQNYTNRSLNARVDTTSEGKLIIEARRDYYQNVEYSSARLTSKASWTYGRIEFRAKMPQGRGTWPALWMLPVSGIYGNGSWPDNGEIDIMEAVGYDPNNVHCAIHCNRYNGMLGNTPSNNIVMGDIFATYHTYATEWYPHGIRSSVDGTTVLWYPRQGGSWQRWPFNQPFSLRLNIAVGGNWGGLQGVDPTAFPTQMQVDGVKVSQATSTPFQGVARKLPGTVQAEWFDDGGESFAYHDSDTVNQGNSGYRSGGVDIGSPISDGSYSIGWISQDEWWQYTVQLDEACRGTLSFSVASPYSGKSFYVELDDKRFTPDIAVPNTGDWNVYREVKLGRVSVPRGTHRFRVIANTDGWNFNLFRFLGATINNTRG